MKVIGAALVASLALAGTASAQHKNYPPLAKERSSWGVQADFTPRSELSTLMERFIEKDTDIKTQDFRIGIVRGSATGGDWGVSYYQTALDKASYIDDTGPYRFCMGANCGEVTAGDRYVLNNVTLKGVEVHKYMPFVTINDRVQIGMNIAGGASWVHGTAEKHRFQQQVTIRPTSFDIKVNEFVSDVPAREVFKDQVGLDILPNGRLEGVLGVIVGDHMKVKVGGGLNFPWQHIVTVGATYLF
jgi:hypothetical protein